MNGSLRTCSYVGLGAGLMYFFDRDRGKRRRALARDKAVRLLHWTRSGFQKAVRDAENRAHGIAAGARSIVTSHEPVSDEVLAARVRSRIGRIVSHPRAIDVIVQQGRVTLRGPILSREVDHLLDVVRGVDGVQEVINQLEPHERPENIPSLQGGVGRPGERWELMQTNWTPAIRLLVGALGGGLAAYSLKKRDLLSFPAGIVGAGMIARATTNKGLKRIIGVDAGRRAVDIQKTITIQAPVEDVYNFWLNCENFPKFMAHIREVRDLGGGRSHWVAEGPARIPVSWDAEITEKIPGKVLAWKSLPGAAVESAGIIRFDPTPDGGTRIQVRMSYNPPAGAVGHVVASLFGANPKREMDEAFVRLKSLLELGKTRSPRGEDVYLEDVQPTRGGRQSLTEWQAPRERL